MTEQREQAPTTPDHVLWCAHCQAKTPHWRGVVNGKQRFVCKACWELESEEMLPRTWQSDVREDR